MKAHKSVSCTLAALALSLCGFAGSAHATSIITIDNGSFESGTNPGGFTTVGTGGLNIDGWTVSAGSVDYIGTYWQAADGFRSLDMGGNEAGKIEQTIVVPEFGNVSINFSMAGNTDGAPTVKKLRVSLANPFVFQDFTFDITGQSIPNNMGWVNFQAYFTGITAGSYTLAFESLEAGPYGPALDNISASVPDGGATLSLLGMALAGFGFLRRRLA